MAWGNKTKTASTKTGGKSAGLEDLFAAERGSAPAAKKDSGDEFDFDLETDLEPLESPPPAAKPQPQQHQAQQPAPQQHQPQHQPQQQAQQPAAAHQPAPPPPQPAPPPPQPSACHIGESVRIEGELSGTEDTTVEGTIEGIVAFPDHRLTVAEKGCVHAEVQARAVAVYGKVVGNITAVDLVELMPSGHMDGDIRAGRVVLMDGAKFSGRIHMGWKPGDDEDGGGAAKSPQKNESSDKTEKAEKAKSEAPQDDKSQSDNASKAEAKSDAQGSDKQDSKDEPKKS